jgi:hypothetical protein
LIQDIEESLGLIITANSLVSLAGLTVSLSTRQVEQITEWAFVNVHKDWENFIEDCFLAYMTGVQTLSGYKPARYVLPNDVEHALKLILAGRDFFQWAKPKRVWEEAELCFENGEPFKTALESAAAELAEMTTIRNEIVHRSKPSNDKFKTFVRHKLKTAPPNITAGQFLTTIKPKTTGTTFMVAYCKKLKVIAKKVVPD